MKHTLPDPVVPTDRLAEKIDAMASRVRNWSDGSVYFYQEPLRPLREESWVRAGMRRRLMLASYSYLGLTRHPAIDREAKQAVDTYGTGTHGVPLLGGTTELHVQLESTIADFSGREAAIVFSSGYLANLATISTLSGPGDYVFSDRWNHASIVDGCLLSRSKFIRYSHNRMDELESKLAHVPSGANKLLVADAVFSMDGDIFPLPEALAICRRHRMLLMVDEAHSLGVLGAHGRGIEEHFGLQGSVDLLMGTLSKTIPAAGGFVAASAETVTFLKHTARGFIFSASLAPSLVAAAKAGIEVLKREGPTRRSVLEQNREYFLRELKRLGFNLGGSTTPILPIIVGSEEKTLLMARLCQDRGVFVLPVLPPAVPNGTSRLRVVVTSALKQEDVEFGIQVLAEAGRQAQIID